MSLFKLENDPTFGNFYIQVSKVMTHFIYMRFGNNKEYDWENLVFQLRALLFFFVICILTKAMSTIQLIDVRDTKVDTIMFLMYSVPFFLFVLKLVYYGTMIGIYNIPVVIPYNSCWIPDLNPSMSRLPYTIEWNTFCLNVPGFPVFNEIMVVPLFLSFRGYHIMMNVIWYNLNHLIQAFTKKEE